MKLSGVSLAVIAVAMTSIASSMADDGKASYELDQYERTGEMRSCLNLRSIRSIKAIDDNHLLVRVGHNQYYLNHVNSTCHGASRRLNRLEYRTPQNQLCRNEIIRVVNNLTGHSSGGCGLGNFERLEKPST